MTNSYLAACVAVIAGVTALLRFLPFLVFGKGKETPRLIVYLGKVLPYAIMAMLSVYCLKGVSFTAPGKWLPELIASALVIVLHARKKNTLLSILCGTVCYMLLVQFVFV